MRIIFTVIFFMCLVRAYSDKQEVKMVYAKGNEVYNVFGYEHITSRLYIGDSISVKVLQGTQDTIQVWHPIYDSVEYVLIDTVKAIKVDSVYTVKNKEATGIFLIKQGKFIAYCLKNGNDYYLTEFVESLHDTLLSLYCTDINNDKKKEVIILYGNKKFYNYEVISFDKNMGLKYLLSKWKVPRPDYSGSLFKVRNNKAYLLYKFSKASNQKNYLKYGVINCTSDRESEFYFNPVSITTIEEWEKL